MSRRFMLSLDGVVEGGLFMAWSLSSPIRSKSWDRFIGGAFEGYRDARNRQRADS